MFVLEFSTYLWKVKSWRISKEEKTEKMSWWYLNSDKASSSIKIDGINKPNALFIFRFGHRIIFIWKKKRLVQKWKKGSFFNRKKDYFTNYWWKKRAKDTLFYSFYQIFMFFHLKYHRTKNVKIRDFFWKKKWLFHAFITI